MWLILFHIFDLYFQENISIHSFLNKTLRTLFFREILSEHLLAKLFLYLKSVNNVSEDSKNKTLYFIWVNQIIFCYGTKDQLLWRNCGQFKSWIISTMYFTYILTDNRTMNQMVKRFKYILLLPHYVGNSYSTFIDFWSKTSLHWLCILFFHCLLSKKNLFG